MDSTHLSNQNASAFQELASKFQTLNFLICDHILVNCTRFICTTRMKPLAYLLVIGQIQYIFPLRITI